MTGLWQDIRFALRVQKKQWGVTLIAVGSLAVAIGGNTAVFGMISNFLLQPVSVDQPERLVVLQERRLEQPARLSTLSVSLPLWADLAERSRTSSGWAAMRPSVLGLRGDDRSEPIPAAEVSADFFDVVGVGVQRGRTFLPDEAIPGGRRVAIVTPEFWEDNRGGVGDPLGSVLTLNGEPVEVIGVLPESFRFLFSAASIWVPLTDRPTEAPRDRRDVLSIARMAPNATQQQVATELRALDEAVSAEHPETQRGWTIDVFNARTDIPDARTKIFYGLLQGSVFFVLIIACANIANLLLARAQERRREIALRTALGAGRWRLAKQLLTESAMLTTVGAALGLALGWLGIRAMAAHFASVLPANFALTMDPRVVLFTAGLSVIAGLSFGLVPAIQTLRASHVEILKEGGGKASAGRSRKLVSRGLVVAEIALSLIALGGGGMLVRSFLELRSVDPGFDDGNLLTARVRVPDSKYPDDEQKWALFEQVLERTRSVEGVQSAAVVNVLPQGFGTPTDTFLVGGEARDPAVAAPRAFALRASPTYVDVLGIEVLQGRFFEDADRLGQAPVAVVNRSFAEHWLPGGDPVGRSVVFAGETRVVVGVVEDVQQVIFPTPGDVESEAIYVPAAQSPGGTYSIVAKGPGDPAQLKEPIRAAVQALDPDLTLSQLLTMDEVIEQFFAGVDVFNSILGGFGILAILLASLGTYGVLAYQVTQRRHEIGIRMAIGAQAREVLTMVTRQGLWMALIGLALGGLVLVPLRSLLASLMQGFATVDGNTAVGVSVILFLVTLGASLLPAYRASSLDPVRALREE